MPYYPGRDDRRSLRLRMYDHARPGAYFVTICTDQRRCSLGAIADAGSVLSAAGRIAESAWIELPNRFASVPWTVS